MTTNPPGDDTGFPSLKQYGLDHAKLARIVGQLREASWGPWENPLATDEELERVCRYAEALLASTGSQSRGGESLVRVCPGITRRPVPDDFRLTHRMITRVHNQKFLKSRDDRGVSIASVQEQCRVALFNLALKEWDLCHNCDSETEAISVTLTAKKQDSCGFESNAAVKAVPWAAEPAHGQRRCSRLAGQGVVAMLGACGMILGGALGGTLGAIAGAALLGGVGGAFVALTQSER